MRSGIKICAAIIVPVLVACGSPDAEIDLAWSDLAVSPIRLDFEQTPIGETSARFVVVTNAGTRPLQVDRIHAPAPFQPTQASLRLEPGASQTLGVAFLPMEAGHAAGTLEFHSQRGTAAVALSGEGQGLPALASEPASIRFGDVQVGGRATASITIANHGGGDLRVTDVRARPPFEATIGEEVVAPASRTDLMVHFAPQNAGRSEGQLVIRSNDPKLKEVLIPLEGAGVDAPVRPAIAVSEQSIDFGAVPVGDERRAFLEIRNDGHDPLALSSITLREPFHASRRGRWIEPGRLLSLPVVFSPSEVGDRSEFMLIHSNDPEAGLLLVALRGRGLERSAGETVEEDAWRRGTVDGERVGGGGADEAGAEAPQEGTAAAEEGAGTEELEQVQEWAGPRVLEGSEVGLASYLRPVGDTHVGEFLVDRVTGTVRLEDVQLPRVNAALKEFFTFSPTEGAGTVDSLGDIEVGLPVQVFDRWGNPAEVDVTLTTATATTIVRSRQISMTGQPVGPDGKAKLVGLATFESGPLRKQTMRIVLHVQVE